MSDFVHLHLHTEYSPLDGIAKVSELIIKAKEMGQSAIAITDHGSMSGLYVAQKAGEKHGIKIIQGCEFYYARENDDGNGHLVLLAKNDEGLKNLMRLHLRAYKEDFKRKPRINFEMLKEHKEGIIILSACLASTINQLILEDKFDEAKDWAVKMKNEFGEDFYLEIQSNTIPEQAYVNEHIANIANALNIELVVTNDSHYVNKEDAFAHEVALGLQINKKYSDPKRYKFPTNDFWLKSEEEVIASTFGVSQKNLQRAISNTKVIADKCSSSYKKDKYLPKYYNIPAGETARSLLVKKVMDGAKSERKGNKIKSKEYMQEVQHEINVIDEEGYCGYYLIVEDYVNTAINRGSIVGEGRGSGASSKVAYLTNITRIEPSKYNLLFERFMAHGRTPDSIRVA